MKQLYVHSGVWCLVLQMRSTGLTEVGHTVQMEAEALRPPPVAPHWPEQPTDEQCEQDQC